MEKVCFTYRKRTWTQEPERIAAEATGPEPVIGANPGYRLGPVFGGRRRSRAQGVP